MHYLVDHICYDVTKLISALVYKINQNFSISLFIFSFFTPSADF